MMFRALSESFQKSGVSVNVVSSSSRSRAAS